MCLVNWIIFGGEEKQIKFNLSLSIFFPLLPPVEVLNKTVAHLGIRFYLRLSYLHLKRQHVVYFESLSLIARFRTLKC